MTLSIRERKALNAADYRDGITRGDSGLIGIGEQTLSGLIERGLLEKFPHPVASSPMYRTTADGKAALQQPEPPKPARTRPRLTMYKPRLKAADTRIVKPWKG